ncbi:MAG: HK97 family phage prohead protease [Pseudomonadota bacterium]
MELEKKFCTSDQSLRLVDQYQIEGYASMFGRVDNGGDIVERGAYEKCLEAKSGPGQIKMLWQHDPATPIGVWDSITVDEVGLYAKGRLLEDVQKAREAAALLTARAIDGLSIGYRTLKSKKSEAGQRLLTEIDLWEVSLVTFPMLNDATVAAKKDDKTPEDDLGILATIAEARRMLAAF